MMFYMDSKVFQNVFLVNEEDQDILDAQYVLVSTRIRRRGDGKYDNIISGQSTLYPDPSVLMQFTKDDIREEYFNQLNKNKTFIATLIKGSIEENYNIIFICSKHEMKLKYLKYLSDYVYMEFGYPIYRYDLYASGAIELIRYDKQKVLKICNKITNTAKDIGLNKILSTEITNEYDAKKVKASLKSYKQNDLIKVAKDIGCYDKGMSKKEIIDYIIDFI